ncbi:MAG: amidase [Chloroflexi bacterium]|nr:MAG: amidase [Chloroflexota bacterium]TMG18965.1 MAG: amidase [Chloroflexota bacterium]TMG67644.1 MAG: amidase [Chloroflexota bacterium]
MRDVIGASAGWLARAIRDRKVSSLEVVRAHLEHIHTVNPRLNAVVFATAESAIKEARAADRHNKRTSALGPLHGVPFTAKDIFNTAGLPTTAGLRMMRSHVPDHDATVIARMRGAGAILIGKTNCPPGGAGSDSWNPLHGGTRNPYDINRSPGGSSSGEASIIAAGGSPLGIGSDSGGSIRMPAHYCGIAALKPTAGLVPVTGAYALPGGLSDPRSQVGPMARFVSDLGLTLPVLVGPDGIDSGVVPVPLPKRTPKLRGLKVAWYADDGISKPAPAIAATVRAAARALADAGCVIVEERPPGLPEAHVVTLAYWGVKHMSHERLYRRWDGFRSTILEFMTRFDIVLSPVAPTVAPLYRPRGAQDHQATYTIPYSLTGNPCVVVRAGTSPENLPIGVQVVARLWHDDLALRAAGAIEKALGGWRPASVVG